MSSAAAAGPVSDAGAAAEVNVAAATDIPAASPYCDNCGTALTGRYCVSCGQRRESPVHSLWQFAKVAAEDLTHADSRLWRTLGALLFRPGHLTREFLAGRRARYLPPVRLYLVLSVAFFLYASASRSPLPVLQITIPRHGSPSAMVTPLGDERRSPFPQALPGESAEERAERVCRGVNYDGPWHERLLPAAHRACVHIVADNGRALREGLLHNVPRALFIFLPLLAGTMMLMYWRPRRYYIEHLLLFVHNHAFLFLQLLLAGLVSMLLPILSGWVNTAVTLYIAWYAYRSMRVVYGQGRGLTFGKLVLLAFFYLVSAVGMLALTSMYTALSL